MKKPKIPIEAMEWFRAQGAIGGKKAAANMTAKQRVQRAKAAHASMTPEQRRKRALKAVRARESKRKLKERKDNGSI
jgi:hypothetical protein